MRLAALAIVLLTTLPTATAVSAVPASAVVEVDIPLLSPMALDLSVSAAIVERADAPTALLPAADGALHLPIVSAAVSPPRVGTAYTGVLTRVHTASAPIDRAPPEAPSPPLPSAGSTVSPLAIDASRPHVDPPPRASSPRAAPGAQGAPDPQPPAPERADGWALPLAAGALVMVLAPMALYHHLRGAAVAEQATRARMREILRERPGMRLGEIGRELGVDPTTARYHLQRLEREGLVAAEGPRRRLRYFTTDGVAPEERARLAILREHGRALEAIAREPGIPKARLQAELAISRATLDGKLRALAQAGSVRLERDGRRVRVFPISF